jgi:hypothetical protein
VRDAESFRDYLIDHLSVPEDQVTTLLNHQATRSEIISAFGALCNDTRIVKQDPIVIFYAGHGSKMEKPEGWVSGGTHIQALVPQDVKAKDASGQVIYPIPDRTIATLLNNLSREKGDNIVSKDSTMLIILADYASHPQTVIFDCCHSSSSTRIKSHGRSERYVHPSMLPLLTADIDADILPKYGDTRNLAVAKGFAHQELRSHVLLAACGSEELAYETEGVGDFTAALLKTLKQYGADRTTYKGCMYRLPTLQKYVQLTPIGFALVEVFIPQAESPV